MTQHVLILNGCPASGKSTFAAKLMSNIEFSPYKRINNDSLREAFDFSVWSKENEKVIKKTRETLLRQFLLDGYNVILDNVHCGKEHFDRYCRIVENLYIDCVMEEKCFYIDLQDVIDRDSKRTGKEQVGEKVVTHWWKKLGGESFRDYKPRKVEFKKCEPVVQDAMNHRAIICDLDGCLALPNGRNIYDATTCDQDDICPAVAKAVYSAWLAGFKVLFVSGREDKYREPTEKFLTRVSEFCMKRFVGDNIDYKLFMRPTGDKRPDYVIKKEIFMNNILPEYYVEYCLDDRPSICRAWRSLGLTVFQLNDKEF